MSDQGLTAEQVRQSLAKYLPGEAVDTCFEWIRQYRIRVRIKRSRQSKLGDYRPPQSGMGHSITINHDLNPYAFLITFTHEVAHLTCFLKHRDRVAPHGEEWKKEFRFLLSGFLNRNIFPEDVAEAVARYLLDPAASSCTDLGLAKALRKYDSNTDEWQHLEDIPYNAAFSIRNGQRFIKGHKLRKNFECIDLHSRHKYFIHPLMEVRQLEVE